MQHRGKYNCAQRGDHTRIIQKELEREHLQSFRCLFPNFPNGQLTDGETPDFLLETPSGRKIGIEHTQVFKEDGSKETAEQARESANEAITHLARMHAENLRIPPAQVLLSFNPQYYQRGLTKTAKAEIGRRIADFVGKNMPREGCSIELESRAGSAQPREVDQIRINRTPSISHHQWGLDREFWNVQHDAIERIQDAIAKKDLKYDECRKKCEECWLLIVAPFSQSGNIHPDDKSVSHVYKSPFSQVFFLDFGLGRLFPLNAAV